MLRFQLASAIVIVALTGCVTQRPLQVRSQSSENAAASQTLRTASEIQSTTHQERADTTDSVVHAASQIATVEPPKPEPEPLPPATDDFLAPDGVLDVNRLVAEVVARNPSVEVMIAAWQAAAQRYPQVVALDDPMLDLSVGPGSWGNPEVESAYMVMASQKIPWPGKRQLRGAIADAETDEAAIQIEDAELQLAEKTRLAFYDYFTAHRQLTLNTTNQATTGELRESAEARFQANLVPQQDVLESELELAKLDRRRFQLERQLKVASARINTLLHRDALQPLPPPPDQLDSPDAIVSVEQLQATALQRRPDLVAIAAQIQADEATLELAWKEFYPDLELYAKYDAFWQEHPLRSAVGVNMNLPVNKAKRCAAVHEAEFRLAQRRAEYERLAAEVSNEIHASYESLVEAQRTALIFEERLIPTAQRNIELARAGYTAGTTDFLRLIQSQRQLIELQEQQIETTAEFYRRLAELDRVAAAPLVISR